MDNGSNAASDGAGKHPRITKREIRQTALSVWFKNNTSALMQYLSNRGVNSADKVIVRASAANTSKDKELNYLQQLASSLSINSFLGVKDIVRLVSTARNRSNLPAFTENIQKQCMNEIQRVAILLVPKKGDGPTVNHRVYKVVFKLLVD